MEQKLNIQKMNTNRNLFRMSIPIFIELLLQLLVGNMDQIMISHYSQDSSAAIVNANQIMNLVIIVLNMISMGTSVVLSQYLGANDKENATKTCMVSLTLISGISIVITIIVLGLNKRLFELMNIEPKILSEATLFLIIVGAFILVQGLYLNFAAILRTFTFMKHVMIVSVIMNVLNIIGNAILINGLFGFPQMGISGSATSTVISKIIGLALIIYIYRKKVALPLKLQYMKPFPTHILRKLCKIAFPSGVESLSYNMSQLFILGIINTFGTMVTATKGYCSILANFSYVYAIAMAQASQIVLGYLLGAYELDAIEKRVWNSVKVALSVCLGLTLVLLINSDLVFGAFTSNPEVHALGRRILMIEFFLEIGRALNIVMTRALIAVGDAKTPMVVGITGHWAIALLFAYLFGKVLGLGLEGVWIAMTMDECTRGFIYFIKFRQRKWKMALSER
ncbi:MATE family efflux transporter [Anaeromicropila herbilytica]|uniref:Putative transporter YisQ n=1 Tax=Anaeromicropila herbilytica TaxID=2785025 RepID=A0A7R7EKF9_9FIRM|nr:MATE family efflux transporter [Anaeromicropila herbilytica]BCN30226.1 putative transporter YisQ [Anaeromicropila herbilytica]